MAVSKSEAKKIERKQYIVKSAEDVERNLADVKECICAGFSFTAGPDNRTHDDLFGMKDWISVLKDAMQTQYDDGNLKDYLDYKQFWDFLDNK